MKSGWQAPVPEPEQRRDYGQHDEDKGAVEDHSGVAVGGDVDEGIGVPAVEPVAGTGQDPDSAITTAGEQTTPVGAQALARTRSDLTDPGPAGTRPDRL